LRSPRRTGSGRGPRPPPQARGFRRGTALVSGRAAAPRRARGPERNRATAGQVCPAPRERDGRRTRPWTREFGPRTIAPADAVSEGVDLGSGFYCRTILAAPRGGPDRVAAGEIKAVVRLEPHAAAPEN